jgi:hypothetical protein
MKVYLIFWKDIETLPGAKRFWNDYTRPKRLKIHQLLLNAIEIPVTDEVGYWISTETSDSMFLIPVKGKDLYQTHHNFPSIRNPIGMFGPILWRIYYGTKLFQDIPSGVRYADIPEYLLREGIEAELSLQTKLGQEKSETSNLPYPRKRYSETPPVKQRVVTQSSDDYIF